MLQTYWNSGPLICSGSFGVRMMSETLEPLASVVLFLQGIRVMLKTTFLSYNYHADVTVFNLVKKKKKKSNG
jgi:hypothetical protein